MSTYILLGLGIGAALVIALASIFQSIREERQRERQD
jgi:hypothetical protein